VILCEEKIVICALKCEIVRIVCIHIIVTDE
jgi:hypothetical protein